MGIFSKHMLAVLTYVIILMYVAGTPPAEAWNQPPAPAVAESQAEFFESRIRPILVENCQSCHGTRKQEGGLRLDTRSGLLDGADTGPVVEPGKADESPLLAVIGYAGPIKMPPKQKLPDQAIANFTEWIKMARPGQS